MERDYVAVVSCDQKRDDDLLLAIQYVLAGVFALSCATLFVQLAPLLGKNR